MITAINSATPLNHSYNNHTNTSFKSIKTTLEDINLHSKNTESPISSMSGDIFIDRSRVKGDVSNMSGDIDVIFSNIIGNVKNMSGKIKILGNSTVTGDVDNLSGSITLNKSSVSGNVSNQNGKILLKDAIVEGALISKPENLRFEGKNIIKELVIKGFKKATTEDADKIKADLEKKGIFIKNIGQINITGCSIVNTFVNGSLISTERVSSEKPLEFKLPKGSVINKVRFDADKQGVLIIDKGTEFLGKVINGIKKRV